MRTSTVLLVLAIVLACAAETIGVLSILSIVLQRPRDEGGPGLDALVAWIFVTPIGLLTLAASLGLKSGPSGLRRVCVILAIICLALPVVASVGCSLQGT